MFFKYFLCLDTSSIARWKNVGLTWHDFLLDKHTLIELLAYASTIIPHPWHTKSLIKYTFFVYSFFTYVNHRIQVCVIPMLP